MAMHIIKKQFIQLAITLICLSVTLTANASHLAGASITYQCLGGLSYELSLKFYRDCSGISAPSTVSICAKSTSCSLSNTFTLNLFSVDSLLMPCGYITDCSIPSQVGMEVYTYVDTITISDSCADWKFTFGSCCRSGAITTGPSGALYIEADLDNLNAPCNSSPEFIQLPFFATCWNQPFTWDYSAIDIDGDSLVYIMISPMYGNGCAYGGKVTYYAPLTALAPISSSPSITLNSSTGLMTINATVLSQLSVMAVRVEQYRNGNLIGTIMRDIQIFVIDCATIIPVPSFTASDSSLTVTFTDSSLFTNSWFWDFGDGDTSSIRNPIHTYGSQGTYNVCLKTYNNCDSDSICLTIVLCKAYAQFSSSATDICVGDSVSFTNLSSSANNFDWYENASLFSSAVSPSLIFNTAGSYTIMLVADSGTCLDTATMIIKVHDFPQADFSAPDVCLAITTAFTDLSISGGSGIASWYWDFGDGSTSTSQHPTHLYTTDSTYNVQLTVTDSSSCASDTIISTSIFSLPVAKFGYVRSGLTVVFSDSSINAGSWFWVFGDGNTSTQQNDSNVYTSAGSYVVCLAVTDSNGCYNITCDTITVTTSIGEFNLSDQIYFYPNPMTKQSILIVPDNIFAGNAKVEIKIYDMLGYLVHSTNISGTETVIRKENLATGLYFYEITSQQISISRGKFVVR